MTWIVKDNWIGLKKEFYDEDEDLLKILTVNEQLESAGVIILTNVKMTNVQSGQSTVMSFSNVEVNTGLADNTFTERIMRRGIR